MRYKGYDIIGDVHGCAESLEKLLCKLGYSQEDGVYFHTSRQAVFVGDIVDRGPQIRQALHLVKNMVDAGSAQCVMGNHEYDALSYITPTSESEDSCHIEYVRAHNQRHNRLIAETLQQFARYTDEWQMFLEWFRCLPVFLDFGDFRVVHACWDHNLIDQYRQQSKNMVIDNTFVQRSADKNSFESKFMDRLTRGTDMALPDGRVIKSHDGHQRRIFRTKFWAENPQTFADIAFQPDPLPEDLAQRPLTIRERQSLVYYDETQPPLFIGHYWLHGKPKPLKKNIACLDYGAVKYGYLVAYRFDGEESLKEEKFDWVIADPNSLQACL